MTHLILRFFYVNVLKQGYLDRTPSPTNFTGFFFCQGDGGPHLTKNLPISPPPSTGHYFFLFFVDQSLPPSPAYFEIWVIEWHRVKNDPSDFEIFLCAFNNIFYHFHIISDWFWNIFPQKKIAFSAACQIQNDRNRKLYRLIFHNHTTRETAYRLIHKWSYLKK